MRKNACFALLLVIGVLASGCGAPEPPMACWDGEMPDWEWDAARHDWDYDFEYCEHFDMVCNQAVTLADECPEFISGLIVYLEDRVFPVLTRVLDFLPWLDVDELMSWILDGLQGSCGYYDILDRVGTCQLPGEAGDPCAEDADCQDGFLCVERVCGGAPA